MDVPTLFSPLAPTDFLRSGWLKAATPVRGTPKKFEDLCGWKDVGAILGRRLDVGLIRLTRGGRPIAPADYCVSGGGPGKFRALPERVVRLLADRATLLVRGVDQHVDAVRDSVHSLGTWLGARCHANAYCSWPGAEGFGVHFDGHDVIVTQVEGRKRWQVFAPTELWPLEAQNELATGKTPEPDTMYLDVTLSRGDLLYVPRGHWHRTEAVGGPSLHLTFGITCRTGLTLLDWLDTELRKDVQWREALPMAFGLAGGEEEQEALRDRVRALLNRLASFAGREDLVARMAESLVSAEQSVVMANLERAPMLPEEVCPADWLGPEGAVTATDLGRFIRVIGVDSGAAVAALGGRERPAGELAAIDTILGAAELGPLRIGDIASDGDPWNTTRVVDDLVRCGAVRRYVNPSALPPSEQGPAESGIDRTTVGRVG